MTGQTKQSSLLRRCFTTLLRFGVAAGCLIYALWGVELSVLGRIVHRYDMVSVGVVVALPLLTYFMQGLRLRYLTSNRLGIVTGILASILALGVNNILPAKLGEIAKVFYVHQHSGISRTKILGLVFWERFFDLNLLMVLSLGTIMVLDEPLASLPLGILVLSVWGVIAYLRRWPDHAERGLVIIPNDRLRKILQELHHHIQESLSLKRSLGLGLLTIIIWGLYILQSALVFMWVAGFDLNLAQVLVVFVAIAIGVAQPVVPGGLGVVEAAAVLTLSWFGIGKEEALAAGLLIHMIQYIPTTIVASVVLAQTGLSLKKTAALEVTEH